MSQGAEEIFHAARQKTDPGERNAYLEGACARDPALRAEVESLLAADAQAEGFLRTVERAEVDPDSTLLQAAGALPARRVTASEKPGQTIDRYKLLQLIGEGGFGTVWMAQQDKPVSRKVALKIIKLGMDTGQVVARFEQERQALAVMDHPNVAKVLDAGSTQTGRPYFVMELVKGVAVTEYCDKNNLSIQERLELFEQVCAAVQHAHTKGIIHRDIKPSNVLVLTLDGRPSAKVIDFGIAKATASKLTERTLFTEHRQLVGTPEYMSPEQAEGSLDVDTRTDVYSLGVLLYELLTGSTPFSGSDLRSAAYAEIQRIIREVEPPRPSTRLTESAETIATVAASRRSEPRKLGDLVRGELDWIVMKALEKDRARRYETASGLATDIRRYLDGDAVVAAPPSTAYRLTKFVRRNKGAVTAAGAVAAALLVGVVAFAWQARVAQVQRDLAIEARLAETRQREVADAQRDRAVAAESEARKRAQELKAVSEFQSQMLSQIDTADAGAKLMTDLRARFVASLVKEGVPEAERTARAGALARELLRVNATDAAMELIDRTILRPAVDAVGEQFKDQPTVDASLRQTLADLYRNLGRYDDARPLQDQAAATRRRVLGSDHRETLGSVHAIGKLFQAQGKLPEAERAFREALDSQRRVLGEDHPDTLQSLHYLGRLFQDQGKFVEAEPLLREAMEKARRTLGNDHPDTINFTDTVGLVLETLGRLDEAEPYLREAMEASRRVNGDDGPDTITAISNYGYLLQMQGKFDQAERYTREALERCRRVRGEEHPLTINAINNLAFLLDHQGKSAESEPLYRECVQTSRRTLGDEHSVTLRSVGNLGNALRVLGRLDEAEPYLRERMESSKRILGDDHRETLAALNTYGYLLIEQGRPAEAAPYWREAYEKGLRALGEDHPDVLVWTANLGGLLRVQGKFAEAEPYLRLAVSKFRRVQGNDHPGTLAAVRSLANLLQSQEKFAEAEPLYREVLETRRRTQGPDHPDTHGAIADLALVSRLLSRFPEAEALYREAAAAYQRVRGKDDWVAANMRLGLSRSLIAMDRFADAQAELTESERVLSTAPGVPAGRHRQCAELLVALYEAWNKAEPGTGHDATAAKWKAKVEAFDDPAPPLPSGR